MTAVMFHHFRISHAREQFQRASFRLVVRRVRVAVRLGFLEGALKVNSVVPDLKRPHRCIVGYVLPVGPQFFDKTDLWRAGATKPSS
jgi:hypothetical protein